VLDNCAHATTIFLGMLQLATPSKGTRLPHQGALFGDETEQNASALVTVTPKAGRLSAGQRTFNRLTERIRRYRETLATWDAFLPRFQGRVTAELLPVEGELRAAQRRVVQQLDLLLAETKSGERLNRKYREKARWLLLDIIDGLLGVDSDDPELEALYDRYSEVSRAELKQEDMEITEAMLDEMFGPETTRGHDAQDVDELLHFASQRISEDAARMREQAAGRTRKRGSRASRAAERAAQAAQEAGQSLREIYRKLASALHPDRETDPAERERKTGLMQRANQAYERNDLLELLSLQIETEQIDASSLANVPETRLQHYNQVLLEQTQVLEAQLQERTAVFRFELDLTMHNLTPQLVERTLVEKIAETRIMIEQIDRDLAKLVDPKQRRAVLDELSEPEVDDAELDDLAGIAAMFKASSAPSRSSTSKKRKMKKQRKTR